MSALSRMAWAAVVLLGTIALVVAVSKSMSASMSPPSPHASASHTSSAPASHTSSAPASHTSSAPASHTSSAPASQTSPTSSEQTSSASRVTAVILLVVLATIGTYLITGLTRGRRLADGRGLGTLRPAHLRLTATVRAEPGRTGQVRLVAEPRPLGEAPGPRLALEWPAFQLARLLRRGPPTGYTGEFEVGSAEPVLVKWANPPKARYTWWYRGTHAAAGYIQLDSTQVARPWERILAASIGPGTAGRIEWARLLATSAAPFEASEAGEVAINAPSAWQSDLEEQYQRASDFSRSFGPGGGTARLRHAMGRAVVTSAGPRLDVGGAATKAVMADKLLDAAQLVLGKPALVVLQAEPADEAIDTGLRDDAPERLALAADLIEVGAPAVLVLPALRSDEARLAIDTIAEQATDSAGCDARVLRARLRERLESNVEQTILDDVVLFINPGRNQ